MRKIDFLVLMIGLVGAVSWVILSGRDGFKANSATIVARTISVVSTIDGQIENDPPEAGARVQSEDLLVRVSNGRIDRSRLAEFEGQIAFLTAEIENFGAQQIYLKSQLAEFTSRAEAFSNWIVRDIEVQRTENSAALEIARKNQTRTNDEVSRAEQLFEKNLTSEELIQTARINAEIAGNEVRIREAQLLRNEMLRDALMRDGVFFQNGDASYWAKMVDSVKVRVFDNENRISTLRLQLVQAKIQADVERRRLESSFAEEHRAPFDGIVNASFVTRGTRVTTGANLYQILDCAKPVIIIPIPDNRVSEFSVGLRVTVYPTDTDQSLPGTIRYVTSGTLIGADTSIQIQQDLILQGNRAIVELDSAQNLAKDPQNCEAQRKAVVVIHTKSLFDRLAGWVS